MMDLLGWGEWAVIAILALMIVGPKDLPRFLYTIGQWIGRIRESTAGFRQEFDGLMRLEHLKTLPEDFPEEDERDRDGSPQKRSRDPLPFASSQNAPPKTVFPRASRKRKVV